jgi:hypothetical protein
VRRYVAVVGGFVAAGEARASAMKEMLL